MIWERIEKLPASARIPLPAPYRQMYLISILADKSGWLVGPYKHLTRLATDLRTRDDLRDILAKKRVRFGLRQTDVPPADVERQERYGPFVRGANHDQNFAAARVKPLATPFRADRPAPGNRISDRKENVMTFWATQTPQSHHIVEFNHLEELGVSHEPGDQELDHGQLPAVLLAGEFHQRYLSAILKQTHGWDRKALQAGLTKLYRSLYVERSHLFHPLWDISKIILVEAGIKTG